MRVADLVFAVAQMGVGGPLVPGPQQGAVGHSLHYLQCHRPLGLHPRQTLKVFV